MSISDDLDLLGGGKVNKNISSAISDDLDALGGRAPEKQRSFYDLSKEDQAKAMDLAKQQISAQYPNMPNWLRDMMLTITPKDESPRLQRYANEAEAATNPIGVTAGGLFKGFEAPFQGAASFIPGKIAQDFANADPSAYFPEPRNDDESMLKGASELAGSLGPLGKLFGGLKGVTQLARVPKALQNATALVGTGAIATPGDAMDKTLGALGALGLGGAGKVASAIGTKVPAFMRGLMNDSSVKGLVEAIQKPHDILSNTENQLYNYVRNAISKRNVKVNINPQELDEILEYPSMQTKTHKELVQQAKLGDYDAIHKLQSSLYKKGSKDLLNDDSVVETRGENLLDLRNRINQQLHNDLVQQGHVDIAHVLQQGKNFHKQIMETYFDKNLPKSIGKLVHPELRLIPENPENIVSQNSKPMAKFLKQHPEAEKQARGINEKQAAIKSLGKILGTTAKVGGVGYVGKSLYDFLS